MTENDREIVEYLRNIDVGDAFFRDELVVDADDDTLNSAIYDAFTAYEAFEAALSRIEHRAKELTKDD